MDEVYIYIVKLPPRIKAFTAPCADGYTVYINESLSGEGRLKAYNHELRHIRRGDFEKDDVQRIEAEAHSE